MLNYNIGWIIFKLKEKDERQEYEGKNGFLETKIWHWFVQWWGKVDHLDSYFLSNAI